MIVQIEKIKPNPQNPRVIKDDKFNKLVKSIKEFPEMLEKRPLVVFTDKDGKYVVLGGNMRLKAAHELGMKELPIILADEWTEEQKKEFLIKDNIGFGEWNWSDLIKDWDSEKLIDWGIDIPKFKTAAQAEEDDYEIPEELKTNIVLGDVFDIGNHRLICGDATISSTYEKILGDKLVDMVLTDPPYNVAYEGKTKEKLKIKNDKQSDDEFYKFLYNFYNSMNSYVKAGGAWYIWHADSEGANFRKAMKDAGVMVKQCLVWVKQTMVMGRQDYQWKHEPCLYGWKEGAAHVWYSDRKQTTVLNFDRPSRNAEHPTMKPIPLFGYLILNSSKEGDIVFDSFGGSGTTMLACEQLNRSAYLIEYDPQYCQVIIDRMLKFNPNIDIKKNGIEYKK